MKSYEKEESLVTEIWQKYEKSRDYLDSKQMVSRTNECWRFYLGDQWHGLECGKERLPSLNFIKGVVRYKTAVVSQNAMTAAYSPMGEAGEKERRVCELLNQHFRRTWEKGKMDTKMWEIVKAAQVQGDAYLFYGSSDLVEPQVIPNVNVLLADEQETNIQNQKYVMIYERRFVSDIRKEAKKNGIPAEQIETIVSDEETNNQLGGITELKQSTSVDGKCVSILYLSKDSKGIVHMARSTRTCVYQPDQAVVSQLADGTAFGGLRSYPIVSYIWEKVPGSARGQSEVRNLIPNQLELNKTLARRSMAVQLCAFPRIAYDANAVTNPKALDNVGMKVEINNASAKNINDLVSYLHPVSMSPDARVLSEELMNTTRELAGAGESATGAVDPTRASGAAIIAVKNQNELPLNENVATKIQFVEDLALLWFDMWVAYNPNGLSVQLDSGEPPSGFEADAGGTGSVKISPKELQNLRVDVRVDVSQANPFSKLAQEQALERMMMSGQITFEEYIEALDDDSNVPRAKIKDILQRRKAAQQQGAGMAGAMGALPQMGGQDMDQAGAMNAAGDLSAMIEGAGGNGGAGREIGGAGMSLPAAGEGSNPLAAMQGEVKFNEMQGM